MASTDARWWQAVKTFIETHRQHNMTAVLAVASIAATHLEQDNEDAAGSALAAGREVLDASPTQLRANLPRFMARLQRHIDEGD